MAEDLGWNVEEIKTYTDDQLLQFWNADLSARAAILAELERREFERLKRERANERRP